MRGVWCRRVKNIRNQSYLIPTYVCPSSSISISFLSSSLSFTSAKNSLSQPILLSNRSYSSCSIRRDSIQVKDGHTDHIITMPVVADAKEGTVDEWYKNEGDSFKSGDKLCTVTLDIGLTIAIDAPTSGILGEIYSMPGKPMKIDTPIAMFVEDSKQYFAYVEDQRVANMDQEKQAVLEEIKIEENKKPDAKGLLREIKVLLQNGDINSESPFAKTLQKLARQSNPELVSIYEASCEGSDFDKKFFIQNAEDIVAEYEQSQTK